MIVWSSSSQLRDSFHSLKISLPSTDRPASHRRSQPLVWTFHSRKTTYLNRRYLERNKHGANGTHMWGKWEATRKKRGASESHREQIRCFFQKPNAGRPPRKATSPPIHNGFSRLKHTFSLVQNLTFCSKRLLLDVSKKTTCLKFFG